MCKRIDPEIYDQVKRLSLDLVNASEVNDRRAYWGIYQRLKKVCADNEESEKNHPFQWEALADFTSDDMLAIRIYEKALGFAQANSFEEYSASICIAIAERYKQIGDPDLAYEFAKTADELASNLEDLDLRREISEFLLNESG